MSMPERNGDWMFLHVGRGGGPPADGIEEGVEPVGRVEAGRLGEGDLLDDLGPRLDLPDDLELLAEAVVLDGEQRDEVLGPAGDRLQRRGRQRARLDLVDHPAAGPDADELALLRQRSDCTGHHAAPNQRCSTHPIAPPRIGWLVGFGCLIYPVRRNRSRTMTHPDRRIFYSRMMLAPSVPGPILRAGPQQPYINNVQELSQVRGQGGVEPARLYPTSRNPSTVCRMVEASSLRHSANALTAWRYRR